MAFSGKVPSFPIKHLPSLSLSLSLLHISICISSASHLRTIQHAQLTSTIIPIPERRNWSKLQGEISAWTDAPRRGYCNWLLSPLVFTLAASANKPELEEKTRHGERLRNKPWNVALRFEVLTHNRTSVELVGDPRHPPQDSGGRKNTLLFHKHHNKVTFSSIWDLCVTFFMWFVPFLFNTNTQM